MAIGDLIFKLMGQQDPRQALLQQVAGGGTDTPQPAQATSPATGQGGGAAAPAAPAAQPEVYQSPSELVNLYSNLLKRQEQNRMIDRGIGLIGASLAYEENRPGIMAAFNSGSGGEDPASLIGNIMKLNAGQAAMAQKAAQRATVPAIAAKYGLDVATAQYLFDTGKLDAVIAEAEKPNNEIVKNEDGTFNIVDKTDGKVSETMGQPKKRAIELVDDGKGGKIAVYADDKSRVGKNDIPAQREIELVDDPITGGKVAVYKDDKTRVGTGDIPGSGATADEKLWRADEADRAKRGMPSRSLSEFIEQTGRAKAGSANLGPNGVDYGDPPKDMAWKRNADGSIATTPDGRPIALPISGGPAEVEAEAAKKADAGRQEMKETTATIVTQDIDRALELISKKKDDWLPATGMGAALTSWVPGSTQKDVAALVETVKSNVGMDKLQSMRDNSKTGAALGPVSDFENKLLQATIGNLDLTQSHEQAVRNLNRVKAVYQAIIDKGIKPGEEAKILSDADQSSKFDSATSLEDLLKQYGE